MSSSCFDREGEVFIVLINHEEQYSIWPAWKAVPGGWTVVDGVKGDKKTVTDFIDQAWTDMRPLSLRQWMAEQAASAKHTSPTTAMPTTASTASTDATSS